MDSVSRRRVLACLAVFALLQHEVRACRFAELLSAKGGASGDHHGRELLALHPTNNTGKDEAVHNSLKRYGATAESFAEYVRKHGYVNVQDLITPVGNYTDLEYLWDSAQLVSKYLPGAVHYTIQSIPEMLEAVKKSLELDISNMVEFAHLDKTYAAIFLALEATINPTITGLALRLTFHDAGTYDPKNPNGKGGANGSIRFEFDWPSNGGLQRFMWPPIWAAKQILDQVLPKPVSYADLVAIVGPVGIYQTHGPLINVGYGRPDTDGPDTFTGVGSNTNQQRDYPITEIITEWEHFGYTIEDLVTLSGGHCIGLSASTNPQGSIGADGRRFSNKYYKQILLGDAFFGSDKALGDNPDTLSIVKQYAADNDLFFRKFTEKMVKLTWLGVDPSVPRLGL